MRIEYNCVDCETPICELCQTHEHATHRCESITASLDRLIPAHMQHCTELDDELELLQRDVTGVDQREAATDNPSSKQELARIRNNIYALMTKYHTLRWWIALAIERSRDAFLLRELQGHVQQRLRQNGRVDVTTTTQQVTTTPEIQPVVVQRPDDKKPKPKARNIPMAQPEAVVTRSSQDSFIRMLSHKHNSWLMAGQVHIAGDGCSRIGLVNKEVWMPIRDADCIKILEAESGALVNVVELPENTRPWAIQQINHSTIIMAGEHGIYRLKADGSIHERLHEGTFNDVNADGNCRFVCLEYTSNTAMVFESKSPNNDEQWRLVSTIKLRTGSKHHLFSSVMSLYDSIIASGNTVNAVSGAIHKYSPRPGAKRYTHEKATNGLRRPVLCCIDAQGYLLIADSWNDKILLMSPEWTVKVVKLNNQVNIRGAKDVLFLGEDTMWVLAEEAMGSTLLVKYKRERIDGSKEDSDENADDVTVVSDEQPLDEAVDKAYYFEQ